MKTLTVTLGLLACAISFGQDLFGNDKEAYVLMPSQAIASGVVRSYAISPSGRFIFYRQVVPGKNDDFLKNDSPDRGKWFVYDRTSKSSSSVKFPIPIGRVMALGDDRNVFFSGYGEGNTEGFLNLATGQSTPLDRGDTRLIYSGEKAYAPFLIGINKAHDSLGIFFPNGKSATAKLNPSISFGPLISGNAEALNFSGSQITIGKSKGANLTPYKIALNLSSMTVNYVLLDQAAEEAFTKGFQNPFNQRFATRSSGDMAYIQLAELERVTSATIGLSPVQNNQQADPKPSESGIIPKSTRLGPSEGQIEFSAQNDIVVYQDAGSLLFRVIQPIDPAAARQLGMDIVKKKLLSKVKQVGIGFIIYGSDNDDVLPGAEGWENKLMPYMKNRELMNDFNYTFRGGDMTQINDPAGTELGFAVGPGGRAVVYMDGHAKWIPNP